MPSKSSIAATESKLALIRSFREEPEAVELAFMATPLITCTLPHSDPGNVPVWTRRNNNRTLVIQPGWDSMAGASLGYPYGILPRLLLIWIVTTAKRTNNPRLELGHNLSEFMRDLGLDPSRGGKRSDATRLKEAARRLFAANIEFHEMQVDGTIIGNGVRDSKIAHDRKLFWDTKDPKQSILWGSYIVLGPNFFAAIMKSVVPCDKRALRILKRSSLALDLYMLCNWLGVNYPGHFVSWTMLGQQLGVNYSDTHDLKRAIKAAMSKVKRAHPSLNYSFAKAGGLTVYASPGAVQPGELQQPYPTRRVS